MRKISADSTVLWKYVLPIVWILCMGIGAVFATFRATTEPGWLLFVLGWLIASGYLVWFARRLKVVSIDADFVYVSQGQKQIQIPLAHIATVRENFWARPKLITLRLNHTSEFGNQIVFVPTTLFFAAVRSHPIVQELQRAIMLHKQGQPPGV